MCPGAFCILASWKCDGTDDCPHGEDEVNCPKVECNLETEFACKNEKNCINKDLVCNGIPHCPDHSDEMNCPAQIKGESVIIHFTLSNVHGTFKHEH